MWRAWGEKPGPAASSGKMLWSIFAEARAELARREMVTWADVFGRITDRIAAGAGSPYAFAVVDEAQDLAIGECRFLATLAGGRPDGLFFTGDLGQRIFQQSFPWKALGIDVRGRSHTLRINYRTSHQIRTHADRLLPTSIADVDGNAETRKGTVSVFNGPPSPTIPISPRSTIPSGTCSMSPVPVPATTCWYLVSSLHPNF